MLVYTADLRPHGQWEAQVKQGINRSPSQDTYKWLFKDF